MRHFQAFNEKYKASTEKLIETAKADLEALKTPFPEVELQLLTDPGLADGEVVQAPGFDLRMKASQSRVLDFRNRFKLRKRMSF